MTSPLAILQGTELECVGIAIACALLGAALSLILDIAAKLRARADSEPMLPDNRDFCEDLAPEVEQPPIQAYKPPLTDVLK